MDEKSNQQQPLNTAQVGEGGGMTRFMYRAGLPDEVTVWRNGKEFTIPGAHLKQLMEQAGVSCAFRVNALALADAVLDLEPAPHNVELRRLARHVQESA